MSNNLLPKAVIVIDPGHGGATKIGGSSPNNAAGANGLLEKDLTLDIARRTASLLKDSAKVVLTRDDDKNLSLAKRAAIAGVNNASVFLSIHFNGFRDKNVDGTETFTATKASAASEKLARNVQNNLINVTQVANRGVKRADLGVLLPERHLPQTAACLAEIAFLTSPKQAKQLEDAAYRQQIAVALGDAILKSLPEGAPAVPAQGFSFGDTENLDERHFQPLGATALDGNPVFDITASVGKGGANKEDDVFAVKKRLIALGYDWLNLDKKIDNATIDAIRLFQTIIAGHNSISGDGKIDAGKNTYLWLQAVNAPRWQAMPAGSAAEGFFNYELTAAADTHDFGTDWLAATIKSAAAHYRDNYLKTHAGAALLTVNDVSLPHGGNTPDHSGHEAGLSCDLQLPRTDGKAGFVTHADALYDRSAARAVINALRAQAAVAKVFFNDQTLINEGLCHKLAGHDNHIHFEINAPARGAVELDGMFNYHSGNRLYQGSYQDDVDYQTHSLEASDYNFAPLGDAAASNCRAGFQNPGTPAADERFVTLDPMRGASAVQHGDENAPNVFMRWSDIPAGACEVDVVVHFHGYNMRDKNTLQRVKTLSGLDLSGSTGGAIKRQRPTLCILPLGRHAPSKARKDRHTFPYFTDQKSGLQNLIDFGMNVLAVQNNLPYGTFTPGRLILTAHSGGGTAVAGILRLKQYDVAEVHLFDATYGGASEVNAWLRERLAKDFNASTKVARADGEMPTKGGALRVLYRACGDWNWKYDAKNDTCNTGETETQARFIETEINRLLPANSPLRRWYRVEKTTVEHNDIPKTFGFQLLANASRDLLPAPAVPTGKPACCPTFPSCVCRGKPAEQKPQSLGYEYEETDYFAPREADYMNY
jgi:N-acetylmuramoyl-L-alanine amidase